MQCLASLQLLDQTNTRRDIKFAMTMPLNAQMDHILKVVFALPADSILQKALAHEWYTAIEDFITEQDEILDSLEYPDGAGKLVTIPE